MQYSLARTIYFQAR